MTKSPLFLVVTLALGLAACVPTPPSYGIPAQHTPLSDDGTPIKGAIPLGDFVRADDPGAQKFFVKDVRALESNFRWTLAEPEFRFLITGSGSRWLHMEFGINDRTIKDTGPLRMVIQVNGHVLDRPVFPAFGLKYYDKEVPAEWLNPGEENRVLVRILNPWQSSDPAVRLGIVLNAVGLIRK